MEFGNYAIRLLCAGDLRPYFEMIERNRNRLESFFAGTVLRTKTLEDTRVFVSEIIENQINGFIFLS